MAYTLVVGDSFHHQDAAHEHAAGVFATASEAIAAARQVIDRSLAECLMPGITAEALLSRFRSFGEITYILGTDGEQKAQFDPWSYAREKAVELTRT